MKKEMKFPHKAACSIQAEIMYDMIREWPSYLKVPFPIAKVKAVEVDDMQCCIYDFPRVLYMLPSIFLLFLLLLCKNYSQLSFILLVHILLLLRFPC